MTKMVVHSKERALARALAAATFERFLDYESETRLEVELGARKRTGAWLRYMGGDWLVRGTSIHFMEEQGEAFIESVQRKLFGPDAKMFPVCGGKQMLLKLTQADTQLDRWQLCESCWRQVLVKGL